MATLYDFEDGVVPPEIQWPTGSGLKPPIISSVHAHSGSKSLRGSDEALSGAGSGYDIQWNFIMDLPEDLTVVSAWCWYEWSDDFVGAFESWSPDFQLQYSYSGEPNTWSTQAWIAPIDRPGPGFSTPEMYIYGQSDLEKFGQVGISPTGQWYKFVVNRSGTSIADPWTATIYDQAGDTVLQALNIPSKYNSPFVTNPIQFRLRCEISTRYFWDDLKFTNATPGRLRVLVDPNATKLKNRWKFFAPLHGENGP